MGNVCLFIYAFRALLVNELVTLLKFHEKVMAMSGWLF